MRPVTRKNEPEVEGGWPKPVIAAFAFAGAILLAQLAGSIEAHSEDSSSGASGTSIYHKGELQKFTNETSRQIQMRCGEVTATIQCRHSAEKEPDNEGAMLCNDNVLSLEIGGKILLPSLRKEALPNFLSHAYPFYTPVGLACQYFKGQHYLHSAYSFGASECGGQCEFPQIFDQAGNALDDLILGDVENLSKLSFVRIEQ
jgi:hypothetical protein